MAQRPRVQVRSCCNRTSNADPRRTRSLISRNFADRLSVWHGEGNHKGVMLQGYTRQEMPRRLSPHGVLRGQQALAPYTRTPDSEEKGSSDALEPGKRKDQLAEPSTSVLGPAQSLGPAANHLGWHGQRTKML